MHSTHIQSEQAATASTHLWEGVGDRSLVDELARVSSACRKELATILLQLGRGLGQCHLNMQSLFAEATSVLVEPELQQG